MRASAEGFRKGSSFVCSNPPNSPRWMGTRWSMEKRKAGIQRSRRLRTSAVSSGQRARCRYW